MLLGAAFDGDSLVDFSFDLLGNPTRTLYWCDSSDRPIAPSAMRDIVGTIEVRQLALRAAALVLNRLFDERAPSRAEDLAVLAALNLLEPKSQIADACDQMLRAWPESYRALWTLAFGWPGQGGAEYFAQRYGAPGPASPAKSRSGSPDGPV